MRPRRSSVIARPSSPDSSGTPLTPWERELLAALVRIAESPVRRGRAAATDAANIEVPAPQAITPPPASDRLLLRIPEAAEVLGISRSTMYKLIAAGGVPTVRIGERAVRVSRAALEAFVDVSVQAPYMVGPCEIGDAQLGSHR